MIPVRLLLKNFLPYRTPDTIHFEGVHLACLTGPNGAGKTALLDAITWALWGTARGRRDDDLVYLGQSDMFVQLDFEQEGVTYRVKRDRESGKRGKGSLELFVIKPDGALQTMTESSMRQTQAAINSILRLDYDTFTHSAFLQQGKADAFTTKTPAERKKILSDILGLDRWRTYEDRVKAKLKAINEQMTGNAGRLDEIERELANETQYQRELEISEEAQEAAQEALQTAEASTAELAHAPRDVQHKENELTTVEKRIRTYQNDLTQIESDIERTRSRIDACMEIIELADSIEAGYASLKEAREQSEHLGELLRKMRTYDDDIRAQEAIIDAARAEIEMDATRARTTLEELEKVIAGDISDELEKIREQIGVLVNVEQRREAVQKQMGELREERSGLEARLKSLTTEGTELNERIDALQKIDEAECPLCGQPLTAKHRQDVLASITADRDAKRTEYKQSTERIATINSTVKQYEREVSDMGDQLAQLPKLRSTEGGLARQADERDQAQARYAEVEEALKALEAQLQAEEYAPEARARRDELIAQRDALGYDEATHDDARRSLNEYKDYDEQHRQLSTARESLPGLEQDLTSAEKRQQTTQKFIDEDTAAAENLREEIEELRGQVEEYNRRKKHETDARMAATEANNRVAVARQQISALETQRKRRDDILMQQEALQAEQQIYEQLRQAFGKNGVPAMVIESAIPELEAASNELLARMTDGRMHLRLATQSTNVDGSTRETLDIEIADELGTRAYEMYSGGESFRINFAVRVALSKMLARRAGAHLRTLFIDEGFGTQDDTGRTRLIEAINAIQQDFDLILVITHIEELRDAFPVHILVDKTPGGSRITIQ